MNPLTDLQRAVIGAIIGALILLGAAWLLYDTGHDAGAASVQADWDKAERGHRLAADKLRAKHDKDMQDLATKYININLKVSEDHEKELRTLRLARDADRRAIDRAGGLRISAAACHPAAATAQTADAGQRDEAGATTIRLPQQVENDLWALADDADEVSAQLRACQDWGRMHGFYGAETTESTVLIDRMIAAPNHPAEEPTP